jgi:hypothetical protein
MNKKRKQRRKALEQWKKQKISAVRNKIASLQALKKAVLASAPIELRNYPDVPPYEEYYTWAQWQYNSKRAAPVNVQVEIFEE